MKRTTVNPESLFDSRQYGFSQITVTKPGKHIFMSGQVAWDANEEIVGPNDLAAQTRKSLDNLEIAVQSAGGTLDDIVMLRIYIVNYRKEEGHIISDALKEKFGTENPPASTWVNVRGLADDGFMIEIEAQAVLD